jgi:hypothetical protein
MKTTQLFSCLVLPLAAKALLAQRRADGHSKALYFLDNDPAGSSVVSLQIDSDSGMLGSPVRTPTKGNGLIGNNAMGPVMNGTPSN